MYVLVRISYDHFFANPKCETTSIIVLYRLVNYCKPLSIAQKCILEVISNDARSM
jgi:hypothetical protein